MEKERLKEFVAKNPSLVSMKQTRDGFYVLKYKKKVFYDNLWNEYLEECRGTIIDEDFNIISRPFTKIYNYGVESKAPVLPDETMVDAYCKVNGFMVAMTWHNDKLLVSTTGSTDSEFVDMAKEYVTPEIEKVCKYWPSITFMFECVHPNDPHIIPEEEGLYLIGYRPKQWVAKVKLTPKLLVQLAEEMNVKTVEHISISVGELVKLSKTVKHEGFVFYSANGEAAKIKSPYYLVKKFVARNPRTDKLMRADIKNQMDEEYYPLIDAIQANIEAYTALDEQARLAWVREFLEKQ